MSAIRRFTRPLAATVSLTALLAASPVLAGSYTATDQTSLNNAIASANGDGDSSATITLQNDVSLASRTLATLPTKPITIDTGGHTLTGAYANGATATGALTLNGPYTTGSFILKGAIAGGTGGAGSGNQGDIALYMTAGASGTMSVVSSASITGGAGGGLGGSGGTALYLSRNATFTNSGIVTGGSSPLGAGGVGTFVQGGSTLDNSGTILGGNGQTFGGDGISLGSPTGTSTLTNSGTIQGGTGTTGNGGRGITLRVGSGAVSNSGTIKGGNGTSAIGNSGNTSMNIVNSGVITGGSSTAAITNGSTFASAITNSGTISAGTGAANAIMMTSTGALNLTLQKGSVITGNVVASTTASTANSLTLGGDDNASFDISTIGSQYQNFTVFNKTGASSWSLTGTGTVATPWTISSGTLQLGDGTTDGSIIGDVTDNATFAFNNKGSVTYAGAISGTGAVTQLGTGTTILTGTNSYTGGTTITAGTLQIGNGGMAGNIPGDITDNGTLAFDRSDAVQYAGTISGSGGVSVLAGNFVLTGTNTYTGGTNIAAGATLQLGIPTANGSIAGNVTDNGTLAFNNGSDQTFGGVISGGGQVTKAAAGNTTLTGTNTYSGGTLITFGTVTGLATSFGSGAITDNAALVINQPADAAFANAINGTGSFTKTGTGRLNYTGTGTLTGPTTVAQGLLSVNGSLASSAVTVQSGGTLGGNGTVGATTIQSGGTIAPGNSIGTLHVNGAFVQNAGSTYQVEVDPTSTNADLISVNGTATLQSGAGLNVTQNPSGQYVVGAQYNVLTATGGVNGTYALSGQTTNASAFLGLKDSYDPNNVYLTVVQTRDPATAATTPNQVVTAAGVDSLPVTNPVTIAVLNSSSDAGARSAFDQLSGQVQASAQGALLANGLYVRNVAFDRLRNVVCTLGTAGAQACDGKRLSIWGQGFGGWGGVAGNGNALGLNHAMAGMLIGVDVPVDDWRLGVFGGYDHSDFNVVGNSAGGGSNDYHLGLYGGTLLGDFALRLGASYSFDDINTNRAVTIGSFSDNLRGLYNGGTVQVFGELGYGIDLGDMALEPVVNLAYTSLRTSGFTEAGGPAALTVKSNSIDDTTTTLGLRPSTTVTLGDIGATLRGMVGWRHTFGQVTPDAQIAFAGGTSFSVSGAPIARDAGAVEAGADLGIMENVTFGITYAGQFSSRTTDQTAWGSVRMSF